MATPQIEHSEFGRMPDGREVGLFTLRNEAGMELSATNLGGIVTKLRLPPSEDGVDVVLGFDRLEDYLEPHPYFGALVGRVAGRIPGGTFTLGGRRFELPLNNGENHLHGGPGGLSRRLWKAGAEMENGVPTLRLELESADGDEGYPGNLRLIVNYRLLPNNTFAIEEEIHTDQVTPVSLTHHSYFNLAGEGRGDALDHHLQIFSDRVVPCDENMTPLGRLESVEGQPNDLRQPRRAGDFIPHLFQQHGDVYQLPIHEDRALQLAARLTHPASGRRMDVATTRDYLQFYTAMALDGSHTGKSGVPYQAYAGLCLECQGYPDGVNHPELGDTLIHPGQPGRHTTQYTFTFDR